MRIVTRGDFDGLICSVLLSEVHDIEDFFLAYPKDINENNIEIRRGDIIANLPHHPNCSLWFDHHINEVEAAKGLSFEGDFKVAASCSRVIYDYYNGKKDLSRYDKLVWLADKIDTADFSIEDIKNPHGWFIIERTLHAYDPHGRLGNFKDYFENLVYWIKEHSLSTIFLSDEVQKRIEHVRSEHIQFLDALRECSHVEDNVIITDSRKLTYFPNGNRFLIYTIYPRQNVSVSIFNKRGTDQSVIVCGHNIFNRTCNKDIGRLMARYGGSGRFSAGSCRVPREQADRIMDEVINALRN